MQQALKNTTSYRLKYALQMRRLSATELSRLSKVPFSSISGYLSGKYQPKTQTLIAFANALGTSLKWLVGEIPLEEINDTTRDGDDSMEQTLLYNYRNLNFEGKKFLLGVSRSVLENTYFTKDFNNPKVTRNYTDSTLRDEGLL